MGTAHKQHQRDDSSAETIKPQNTFVYPII